MELANWYTFIGRLYREVARITHSELRLAEQPLDRHHHAEHVRADRAALEEGRLLLQALPPHGHVHLGVQGKADSNVNSSVNDTMQRSILHVPH